jgi:hypothetical protein
MALYAATFDAEQPAKFDRVQVALRIGILIVLSILGGVLGWSYGLIWIGIPVLAAVLISQKGASTYLAESRGTMTKWLGFLVGAYAYLGLLTDKLPTADGTSGIHFDVEPTGTPSVGQALLRIILVIPHLIVIAILGFVAFFLMLIAAVMILISETYPAGIYSFLVGYQRWNARVFAYLASLVDAYPPFAFDTEREVRQLPAAGATE